MDTMELLEQLGCVEPADQEVLARTADALLELAAAEDRRPTVGVTAPVGRVVRLIRGSDPAGGPVSPSADRADGARHQRQRRWVARAAAVAVLAGVAGGAGVLLEPGTPAGPGTAAAAVLKKLAHVAAYQPAPIVPGPGQYLYVDSVESYTDTAGTSPSGGADYTVLLPENRQIWIAANGSGRILETFGNPVFLSAQDRTTWEAAGRPPIQHAPTDMSFGPGGLVDGPTNLSNLPTNPAARGRDLVAQDRRWPSWPGRGLHPGGRHVEGDRCLASPTFGVVPGRRRAPRRGSTRDGRRPFRPERGRRRLREQGSTPRADLRSQDERPAR